MAIIIACSQRRQGLFDPAIGYIGCDDNMIDLGTEGAPRSLTSGIVLSAIGGPCRIAGNSVQGAVSAIAVNRSPKICSRAQAM